MNENRLEYEIMAPVGSRESLAAAINAGAQSVYFGIGQLNMRAHSASTFSIDDLHEIAATCHEHGLKSYLTVNTVIYDEDIETMHRIVDAAKAAKISAVIASDVAVMTYARSIGQEVHLSTQLNISNIEAAKFYAQFADVVVLARELNMEQVAEIHRQIVEQNVCEPVRKLAPHRDVLPRCAVHGNLRKVLSLTAEHQPLRQPWRVCADLPTRLPCDGHRNGQRTGD